MKNQFSIPFLSKKFCAQEKKRKEKMRKSCFCYYRPAQPNWQEFTFEILSIGVSRSVIRRTQNQWITFANFLFSSIIKWNLLYVGILPTSTAIIFAFFDHIIMFHNSSAIQPYKLVKIAKTRKSESFPCMICSTIYKFYVHYKYTPFDF